MSRDNRYLKLLSMKYPNIQSASSEIINLTAILNLPKGTEHFLTDLHGEYEAFHHIMRNASGVIKKKVDEHFSTTISHQERKSLVTLIYYPREKLNIIKKNTENISDWYKITLYRLIAITRIVTSKYTRYKVRSAMPPDFAYIIEELLHEDISNENKQEYYYAIINSIIDTGRADAFIIEISNLICRLTVDKLHIIGDIYDRGPGADIILDALMEHHSVDIQWGNHDIIWIGAAAGNMASIATVIRICARYNNLDTLEDGYGISIRPLVTFAMDAYANDPCKAFIPTTFEAVNYSKGDIDIIAKIHKAITIIQFKLEGQAILRNSDFKLDHRLLLDKINYEEGTITINNEKYLLNDYNFPTIDPKNPYELTDEEANVIERLRTYFRHSEKLQRHTNFLFSKGSMYLKYNNNLLYHGCIPIDNNGELLEFCGFSGKKLFDYCDKSARQGYFLPDNHPKKQYYLDFLWYLWCGSNSPLFGKDTMATFERYFTNDENLKRENKNPYYTHLDSADLAKKILAEFDLDPEKSHIINGHVPVNSIRGENPIKADGKVFIIDGGLSKAYQPKTGIAGYTLVLNSYGFLLTSHEPFSSTAEAIEEELDIHTQTLIVEKTPQRILVEQTDQGDEYKEQIKDLKMLVKEYENGGLKQTLSN